MIQNKIADEYFEWLLDLVCGDRYSEEVSYRKLLTALHSIEFTYFVPNDQNRAADGEDLRYRFVLDRDYEDMEEVILNALYGPCSVLEMMIALALRCEENIMDDPSIGNRSGQWFWSMINNLGLRSQVDELFDESRVRDVIARLLNRDYEPDGRGGLFTVRNCSSDMRDLEIWIQMWRFIDNIA